MAGRGTNRHVFQFQLTIQGGGTPYFARIHTLGSGERNVCRVQMVDGDKVLKDIHCAKRPLTQMQAIAYLQPALGQQIAIDKLKGETWAQHFNYGLWQAQRSTAAKERRAKKGPTT